MIKADDVISNMVEVLPIDEVNGFRKIKETLTRMGIPSKIDKRLTQTAHILHRKGRYYICHFKEMMALDGLRTDLNEVDIGRRNRIAKMLADWNLLKVVDEKSLDPLGSASLVKVVKFAEKETWELVPKYQIGVVK